MQTRFFRISQWIPLACFLLLFGIQANDVLGGPEILLDQLEIISDVSPDSPLEVFEDDHDTITFSVQPVDGREFVYKGDIDDLIGNGYKRYADMRSTVDALIKPFNRIVMDMKEQDKFIKQHTKLQKLKKNDPIDNLVISSLPLTFTGELSVPQELQLGIRIKNGAANWSYFDTDLDLNPLIVSTCGKDKRCLADAEPEYTQPAGKCCWLKKHKANRPTGDTDGDGDEDEDDEQEEYDVQDGAQHCFSTDKTKNHDTLVGTNVISAVNTIKRAGAKTPDSDKSFVKTFTLKIKDRTPPHICDANGNEPYSDRLPELWGSNTTVGICTTGDYNRVEEISLSDNAGGNLTSRFAVGLRNESGEADDAKFVWAGDPLVSNSGTKVNYIFVPNECKGSMNYTIFAWDKVGNLNPGVPRVAEDAPTSCYGLGYPYPNLKPGQDFPLRFKADYSGPMDDPNSGEYSADRLLWALKERKLPSSLGEINITDNDRPNLVIRIESIKDKGIEDKYAFCFPPPSKTLTTSDPDYAQLLAGTYSQEEHLGLKDDQKVDVIPLAYTYLDSKTDKANQDETAGTSAIEQALQTEKTSATSKFKTQTSVTGIKIKDGQVSREADGTSKAFTNSSADTLEEGEVAIDTDFTAMNFRLEAYSSSDTDITGNPITNDDKTYGERNGFGREALVISKFPLIEDVEYLVWIWAEDNVKWSSAPGERVVKSGVKQCRIVVKDPNQNPPLEIRKEINELDPQPEDSSKKELDRFWHGPFRLICREPTESVSADSLIGHSDPNAFLIANKNPFVEAYIKDYAGAVRALKVYFQVSDVKAKVRIIEQKHIRN